MDKDSKTIKSMDVLKTSKSKNVITENKPLVGKAREAFMGMIAKQPEQSLREKVAVFFNETSFTPLVRIYNATNWFKRICWLLVVLGMLSWLSVQCIWLFQRYFRYPVEVKIDIVSAREIEFPSVTVCNLNPLRRSAVEDELFLTLKDRVTGDFQNPLLSVFITSATEAPPAPPPPPPDDEPTLPTITATWPTSEATAPTNEDTTEPLTSEATTAPTNEDTTEPADEETHTTTTTAATTSASPERRRRRKKRDAEESWTEMAKNQTFNQWEMLKDDNVSETFYKRRDKGYSASLAYAWFSQRYPEHVMEAGHNIANFIVSCKMSGFMCSPENFTQFLNHKYGNCFTFNGPENTVNVSTQFAGPIYGLSLELFLEQTEYIGALSPAAGVKVLIHPRNSMPFPEDQGISIPPGYETFVGIRKIKIGRLPAPHGTCASQGKEFDLYMTYKNTSYSKLSCMKSCYQRLTILNCGCAVPFYYVENSTSVCNMTDTKTDSCVKQLPKTEADAYAMCDLDCPQPCSEEKYDKTLSSAQWPSDQYANTLTSKIKQTNYLFMGREIDHAKEFAKLDVYYEDLMYETIEQQEAYESTNLISDVGGQLGLWLGLSAFTLGELFGFLVSLVKTVFLQRRKRSPVKPIDKLHLDNITA